MHCAVITTITDDKHERREWICLWSFGEKWGHLPLSIFFRQRKVMGSFENRCRCCPTLIELRMIKAPRLKTFEVDFLFMTPEAAEVISLQVLTWLVRNDNLCNIFLGASGASVDDLRTRASDVDFQGSVLQFLLMDDEWVTGFCDDHGLDYHSPSMALQSLPGQGTPHWTWHKYLYVGEWDGSIGSFWTALEGFSIDFMGDFENMVQFSPHMK